MDDKSLKGWTLNIYNFMTTGQTHEAHATWLKAPGQLLNGPCGETISHGLPSKNCRIPSESHLELTDDLYFLSCCSEPCWEITCFKPPVLSSSHLTFGRNGLLYRSESVTMVTSPFRCPSCIRSWSIHLLIPVFIDVQPELCLHCLTPECRFAGFF